MNIHLHFDFLLFLTFFDFQQFFEPQEIIYLHF